jgi:metal-responsive CopG/Arc/MetJ family transcriptional regulator
MNERWRGFVLEEDLLRRLDDFRFSNRINSKSDAIRRLLDEALKKYDKKQKKPQNRC